MESFEELLAMFEPGSTKQDNVDLMPMIVDDQPDPVRVVTRLAETNSGNVGVEICIIDPARGSIKGDEYFDQPTLDSLSDNWFGWSNRSRCYRANARENTIALARALATEDQIPNPLPIGDYTVPPAIEQEDPKPSMPSINPVLDKYRLQCDELAKHWNCGLADLMIAAIDYAHGELVSK